MDAVFSILPMEIKNQVHSFLTAHAVNLEEIRLRLHRPIELLATGQVFYPEPDQHLTPRDMQTLMSNLSAYSLYALEEELRRGYVTISGGHRVGINGKVVTEAGHVKRIRDVSSLNIRIAREKIGVSETLSPHLYKRDQWLSTLIIGAPQTGKTTMLRDLARLISSGTEELKASKVGIVDERSEIAGCVKGIPQNTFGIRVDVLDACPKAEGMMMMIRSMSPDVLVVDEIGRKEDTEALLEALNAGVSVFATAHAYNLEQLGKRPNLRPLLDHQLFERLVVLENDSRLGRGYTLFNQQGVALLTNKRVKAG